MSRAAARASRLLPCAIALGTLACAGSGAAPITPLAPTSAASASGTPSSPAASGASKFTVGGVELVPGSPVLAVAGPPVDGETDLLRLGQGTGRRGVERRTMDPDAFRVADLPLVELPEPLNASAAPVEPPSVGEEAGELFVDWQSALRGNSILGRSESYTSVRVSLRSQRLARIRIGGSEGTVSSGAGGGVYVVCRVPDDAPKRFVSARWEVLSTASAAPGASSPPAAKALPNSPATLTITDAWFDMRECKATIVQRTSISARALAGGMLFAYRERCAKCAPGAQTELLTLLSPMPALASASGVGGDATTALGAVTRVSLPIRRGGGGSLVARYTAGITRDWLSALSRDGAPDGDVVVGVDVAQGVGDPEPVAIAYASGVPGRMPDPSPPALNSAPSAVDLFGPMSAPKKVVPKKPSRGSDVVDPFSSPRRLGF